MHNLIGIVIEVECGQIVQPCKQAGQAALVQLNVTSPIL
jgi:hypothetical protein